MKKVLFLALLLAMFNISAAQNFVAFEKEFSTTEIKTLAQSSNGEYYVFEREVDRHSHYSYLYMRKLDSTGHVLLQRRLDFREQKAHMAYQALMTAEDKVILVGTVENDLFICRLNQHLEVEWQQIVAMEAYVRGIAAQELANGSIAVALEQRFHVNEERDHEIHQLIFSNSGKLLQQKVFGEANGVEETGVQLLQVEEDLLLLYSEFHGGNEFSTRLLQLDAALEMVKNEQIPQWRMLDARLNAMNEIVLLGASPTAFEFRVLQNSLSPQATHLLPIDYEVVGFCESPGIGYGITGFSYAQGREGFRLSLLDESFQLTDEKVYKRNWQAVDKSNGILSTRDGGFVLYGNSTFSRGYQIDNSYLIKTNEHGALGYPALEEVPDERTGYEVDYNNPAVFLLDIDQDGDQDLMNLGEESLRLFLYENEEHLYRQDNDLLPEGSFADPVGGNSVSFIDINNDGYKDLYLSRSSRGGFGRHQPKNNIVLINTGENGFLPDTASLIALDNSATLSSHWVDYDQDGYLDVLLNNIDGHKLYKNLGGEFREVKVSGFGEKDSDGQRAYCFWYDFDRDGKLDFLISQSHYISLFLQEDEGFSAYPMETLFDESMVKISRVSDILLVDVNRDRKEDLVLLTSGDLHAFEYCEAKQKYIAIPATDLSLVYTNRPRYGAAIDYDNDGDLDVVLTGGGNSYEHDHFMAFNHNVFGNFSYIKEFRYDARGWLSDHFHWADIDGNGFPDLVKSEQTFFKVFKNKGNDFNWLQLELKGELSNNFGLGAEVTLVVGEIRQTHTHWDKTALTGHVESRLHFGLNTNTVADSVIIDWPSGCRQVLTNVAANQRLKVRENCSGEAPVVAVEEVCLGEPLELTVQSKGSQFAWYDGLEGTFLGTSGRELSLDTISVSQTLFVANTDSSIASRKTALSLLVHPIPEVRIQKLPDSLVAIASSAASYQWFLDGEEIVGATSDYYIPEEDGRFKVWVASEYGCENMSDEINFNLPPDTEDPIVIYPNPSPDVLMLKGIVGEPNYRIIDSQGKQVQQGKYTDSGVEINDLPQGLYVLRISQGGSVSSISFIKQ